LHYIKLKAKARCLWDLWCI